MDILLEKETIEKLENIAIDEGKSSEEIVIDLIDDFIKNV